MKKKTAYARENRILIAILQDMRSNLGMTQQLLARRTGLGQDVISRVEAGKRQVNYFELRRWLLALDLDVATFDAEFEHRMQRRGIEKLLIPE